MTKALFQAYEDYYDDLQIAAGNHSLISSDNHNLTITSIHENYGAQLATYQLTKDWIDLMAASNLLEIKEEGKV